MWLLPTHGDGTTRVTRGVGTQWATGATLTVLDGELDLDDFILAVVNRWDPAATGVTFRTDSLLGLPIDGKLTRLEARLLLGLPFDIGMGRADQINAIIPAFCCRATGHQHSRYRRYAARAVVLSA